VQAADAVQPFGQAPLRHPPTLLIHDLDVVMIFGPIITNEQHPRSSICRACTSLSSVEETAGDLIVQVLTEENRGTSSQQRLRLLTTSGRTVCRETSSRVRSGEC
jgi:hypothetical protein